MSANVEEQTSHCGIIDTHCHLDLACFDADLDAVLARALKQGVTDVVIPGIEPQHWQRQQAIKAQFAQCHIALGYHPFFLSPALTHQDIPALIKALYHAVESTPDVVAIGEIGIDRTLALDCTVQQAMMQAQLQCASDFALPVICHHRKSHDLLLSAFKQTNFNHGGIIHAFSGGVQIAHTYVEQGLYLGVGGTITYPRGHKTLSALQAVGQQSWVLETDSPDMPMHGRQGMRNAPEFITDVVDSLASACNIEATDIISQTTHNALSVLPKINRC